MATLTLPIDAPAAAPVDAELSLPMLMRSECMPEDLLDLMPPVQAVPRATNWSQVTRLQTALPLLVAMVGVLVALA